MREQTCELYDQAKTIKEQMEILRSTLFAIYAAEQDTHYDARIYREAILGSARQAEQVIAKLEHLLEAILKAEETAIESQ